MGKANRSQPPGLPRERGRKSLCDKDFCPTAVLRERPGAIAENRRRREHRERPFGSEGQLPAKSGFRFSKKACMPSFMSSVEASRPNSADSNSWASAEVVSSPR